MKKSRYSEAQIVSILKDAENGCRFLSCAAPTE